MSKHNRAVAVLPAVGAVLAATLLTGAAVYTVSESRCDDSGVYVQHDQHVQLVGGCIDASDLPAGAHKASGHAGGQSTRQ